MTNSPFNLNNIALIAVLGSIAACWQQVRGWLQKAFSILIRTDSLESHDIISDTVNLILSNSKIIEWGNCQWIRDGQGYIKKYYFYSAFICKKYTSIFILYKNFIPCLLCKTKSGIKIIYLYKTINTKKIFDEAQDTYMKNLLKGVKDTNRQFTHTEIHGEERATKSSPDGTLYTSPTSSSRSEKEESYFNQWMLGKYNKYIGITQEDIEDFFPEKENQEFYWSKEALRLRGEVEFCLNNSSWFQERKIPCKRGVLLHSAPGAGKSKMILQIAQTLKLPIFNLNIGNMSNVEFVKNIDFNFRRSTLSILLIEDIDCVFHGRENILARHSHIKNLLTFDTLINAISGAKPSNGFFFIITTNDRTKLDPALIRPGRIDVEIEVAPLDEAGRKFIAGNILKDWPDLIEEKVKEWAGQTVAEFENSCIELAVRKFYEKK